MKKFVYFFLLLPIIFISCDDKGIGEDLELINSEKSSNLKATITVVGQDDPLKDPFAVQDAVDNYDHIILSGVFDFGVDETNGGVEITRSNVILQGPAIINNGAKLVNTSEFGLQNCPLSIRAPGVEVRELDISCNNTGIIVDVLEDGKPVVIDGNSIEASLATILVSSTSCGINVINNDLEAYYGYYGYNTIGYTEIANNNMAAGGDGILILKFDHKLDIMNNSISMGSFAYEAMFIGAWQVTEETGPDWGDNAPVKIIGNSIDLNGWAAGIIVGASNYGINNVMVKENILTGEAGFGGLVKEPYGHNNSFINNDLSGLTSYDFPALWTHGGHHNQYKNNRLGTVIGNPGTGIMTVNWHHQDGWANTPDPVNYANHYSQNDYTQTGLPGWSEDPEANGAVLLSDVLLRFTVDWEASEEPFAMENYVNEKKFPDGTDLCTQILDLSNLVGDDRVMGTNQIAGWNTCEVQAAKATYKLASKRYKNFGQALKERNMKRKNMRKLIK